MRKNQIALLFFTLACLTHVVFILLGWSLAVKISKVFLMPTLAMWVFFNTPAKNRGGWYFSLITALFFSWLGDILLIFDGFLWFVCGLVAFLIAHLAYVKLLLGSKPLFTKLSNVPFVLLVVLLILFPLRLIINHLPADLIIPVIVYSAILLGVFILANFRSPARLFYRDWVIWGALCFVLSDTTLAYTRFVSPAVYSAIVIMTTYLGAQFLLARGFMLDHGL